MRVTITGPNAHGGMFHVHRADCADLKRRPYSLLRGEYAERYTEEHPDAQSIVLSVYDNGIMDEQPEEVTFEDYANEFKWFPCVDALPWLTTDLEVRGGSNA